MSFFPPFLPSFLSVNSLEFSLCTIMPSVNKDSFNNISPSPIYVSFFVGLFLVLLHKLQLPVQCCKGVVREDILALQQIFVGKISFSFRHKNKVWNGYRYFVDIFIKLRKFPSICNLLTFFFNHEWVLNFVKCSWWIYWYNHMIFLFYLICVVNYISWFLNVEPDLHSWDKCNLIVVCNYFYTLLDSS